MIILHKLNPKLIEPFEKKGMSYVPGQSLLSMIITDTIDKYKSGSNTNKPAENILSLSESKFKQALDVLENSNLKDVELNMVQDIKSSLKRIEDLRSLLRKALKKD